MSRYRHHARRRIRKNRHGVNWNARVWNARVRRAWVRVKLIEVVHRVAEAVRKGGVARLALPMNHPAFPRNAAQLRELGVGYTNCAPAPEVRMLTSMQAQVAEARALLA